MKIKKHLLTISLVIMIALSFYLSYLIWVSPTSKEPTVTESTETSKVTNNSNYPKKNEIFLPLKVVSVKNKKAQGTNSETFLTTMQTSLAKTKTSSLKIKNYQMDTELAKEMDLSNGIEMSYAMDFPFDKYSEFFDLDFPLEEDFSFSTIQINYDQQKIRFINKQKLEVAEGKINSSLTEFKEATEKEGVEWRQVIKDPLIDRFNYYNSDPVELKKFSYIATTRPYTLFRDAFFSNKGSLRTNENTDELNIYDGAESMEVDPDNQQVDYQGVVKNTKSFDKYSNSYNYVRQLGTNYGSIRFLDSDDQKVNYHIFVEGFPVFSDIDEGSFSVKYTESNRDQQQAIEIQANLNMIQVPIPSESVVEVQPAREILENLYYAGAKADLMEQLLIGYNWKNIEDTGVVDMEPLWYVRYDNEWYQWQVLLEKLQKEEN
ncbi:MAG TPA: two-component system activity regulator YycH [Tetragenococcus sp.]|nr:two-component system activity regulator YycH [Tetragenococcus sp.]